MITFDFKHLGVYEFFYQKTIKRIFYQELEKNKHWLTV